MAGRKPNLVAYATLALLAKEGRWTDLPPKERMGLILLVVALEAWYQGCHPNYLQNLGALAKDLRKSSSSCLKQVLAGLGDTLRALLPSHYQGRPLRHGLRAYLSRNASGYRARDLWEAFLRRLNQEIKAAKPPCPNSPLALPALPEVLLSLLPVPAVHRALIRILHRAHGVPEKDLEAGLSALFAYGFIHSGTFRKSWHPFLFQKAGALDVQDEGYQGKQELWLVREHDGVAVAKAEGMDLFVYLDDENQHLASPQLKNPLGAWYKAANTVLKNFRPRAACVFCDPQQGYDWDLVEEYHEAVLEGLRDGTCPRFFAKSSQPPKKSAKKERS